MHDATRTTVVYRTRTRIRHWWTGLMCELRASVRTWLGIDVDLTYTIDQLTEMAHLAEGIRRDLGAVAEALKQADTNGTQRIEITEKNVGEIVRQFHVQARVTDSHAELLRAWRNVPILRQAASKFHTEREKAQKEAAAAKRAAEAEMEAPVALKLEDGGALRARLAANQHAIHLANKANGELATEAYLQHPESD